MNALDGVGTRVLAEIHPSRLPKSDYSARRRRIAVKATQPTPSKAMVAGSGIVSTVMVSETAMLPGKVTDSTNV